MTINPFQIKIIYMKVYQQAESMLIIIAQPMDGISTFPTSPLNLLWS